MTPDDVMQWFPVAFSGLLMLFVFGCAIFVFINMWHLSKVKK